MLAKLLGKGASVWARTVGYLTGRPEFLVIHHSDSGVDVTASDIDRWHREERGWAGIAYHWVIERRPLRVVTGRPDRDEQGRPHPVTGAATFGLNHDSLALCVVGNFELEPVPSDVLDLVVAVAVTACIRHGIPAARIIGHCDAHNITWSAPYSSCPGKNLIALLPEIRRRVAEKVKAAGR